MGISHFCHLMIIHSFIYHTFSWSNSEHRWSESCFTIYTELQLRLVCATTNPEPMILITEEKEFDNA